MDRGEASALADLKMHWDEAYEIGLDGNVWWARFRGAPDDLRAHTGAELRELIRADYTYRQQTSASRPPAGTDGPLAGDRLTGDRPAGDRIADSPEDRAAAPTGALADDDDDADYADDYADAYETEMIPDEPETRFRPLGTSGAPGTAGTPGTPNTLATSGTPDMPGAPDTPGTPATPATSGTSGRADFSGLRGERMSI